MINFLFHVFLDKTHKIDKMDKKHFKELMNRESINLLSTGKASKLFSVTPDTILKWIKQDKLPAVRTAGGHYRVSREAINALLSRSEETLSASQPAMEEPLLYCWEFFAENSKARLECQDCLVYRAHALKCFEMNHLPKGMGYNGGGGGGSCGGWAFFHYHHGRGFMRVV